MNVRKSNIHSGLHVIGIAQFRLSFSGSVTAICTLVSFYLHLMQNQKEWLNVIRYGEMNVSVGLIWNRMPACCVTHRPGRVCCGCGTFGRDNTHLTSDDTANAHAVLYRSLKIDEFCRILIGSWASDFLNGVYFWIGI